MRCLECVPAAAKGTLLLRAASSDLLLNAPWLQVWGRGRVTLAGDAAHLATPLLTQGSSQSFEDAVALGRAIGELRGFLSCRTVHSSDAASMPRAAHPLHLLPVAAGEHGPTPEALRAYEAFRQPQVLPTCLPLSCVLPLCIRCAELLLPSRTTNQEVLPACWPLLCTMTITCLPDSA
jgi:hypothetical protein